ncbi:B-box type zinc finger protein with CCT domain [Striga asiatica]|uniref:B-box type zinc finger protein with CCT domain n=1 Tax=Striga asiatica TaxID=4170 RepID=A0A5A7QNY5_STRAF|nr:B-box type zinc finger protein with CCT domain [Striga asiatica]
MECNGIDGRGLPTPKSDDSLGPRGIQPKRLPPDSRPLISFYSLVDGRKKGSYRTGHTTKSSGLNALTTAVQPFLGFVESGFPFTHNGGAAPTRQAATGHNALFAQQIHFEVDLFARPIERSDYQVIQNLIEKPAFIEEAIESITKSTSLKGSLELIRYGIDIIRNRST